MLFLTIKLLKEEEINLTQQERENEVNKLKDFIDTDVHKILKREFIRMAKGYEKASQNELMNNNHNRASFMAGRALGWQEAANACEYMVKFNESLLGKFIYRSCEVCGNIVKKYKEIIKGEIK